MPLIPGGTGCSLVAFEMGCRELSPQWSASPTPPRAPHVITDLTLGQPVLYGWLMFLRVLQAQSLAVFVLEYLFKHFCLVNSFGR